MTFDQFAAHLVEKESTVRGGTVESVVRNSLQILGGSEGSSSEGPVTGDPLDTVEAALVLLRRAGRWNRREAILPESLLAIGFPLVQVVDAINEGPDTGQNAVSIGTVAVRLGVDPSRASRVVAQADEQGLVERRTSALDARRTDLVLTEAGEDVARQLQQVRLDICRQVLEPWPEAERLLFGRLLLAFANGLTAPPES